LWIGKTNASPVNYKGNAFGLGACAEGGSLRRNFPFAAVTRLVFADFFYVLLNFSDSYRIRRQLRFYQPTGAWPFTRKINTLGNRAG